jgi:type II secretory pathway pseudopilin PulG
MPRIQSGSFKDHSPGGQRGYVMIALSLAVALILIALSAGLPVLSAELRRQREEELIHRGVQYTRAIKKYYRRFGGYPTTLEQLEETNHIRFLRKRYKDPMTGGDFRLLHVGEVTLSLRKSAQGGDGSAATGDTDGNPTSEGTETPTSSPAAGTISDSGDNGPALGGGPIIGVASTSKKKSFHVFDNKDRYYDWKFVYSPALDSGGLFTRPYDGIWAFNNNNDNGSVPPPPVQPGAPGITLPSVNTGSGPSPNAGTGK